MLKDKANDAQGLQRQTRLDNRRSYHGPDAARKDAVAKSWKSSIN